MKPLAFHLSVERSSLDNKLSAFDPKRPWMAARIQTSTRNKTCLS